MSGAYSARIRLPAFLSQSEIEVLTEALSAEDSAFSAFKENNNDDAPWIVQVFSPREPDLETLANAAKKYEGAEWMIERVEDRDWLAHSYRQFPPFSVGKFFIYGSHYEGEKPDGQIALQIDAATAFGSGEHGTTSGCLLAMQDLNDSGVCPWNVLEMGTGSGILAIAAWKLWKTPVLAVDNDAEAVRVACVHREANKVPVKKGMSCKCGDGFKTLEVQEQKPFDLVIANILAETLREMAAELKSVCDENAYVILSGILTTQAEEVLAVYKKIGLNLVKRFERGEWSTLVLQNAPAHH